MAYDLWAATADIVENEPPLYLAAGLSSAKAFFEEYLASDERTARRMMRVAKYASPDEENKYGISKIDPALDYLDAKAGPGQRGRLPVDFGKLRIPTYEKDGPRSVLLADATVEQCAARLGRCASPARWRRSTRSPAPMHRRRRAK